MSQQISIIESNATLLSFIVMVSPFVLIGLYICVCNIIKNRKFTLVKQELKRKMIEDNLANLMCQMIKYQELIMDYSYDVNFVKEIDIFNQLYDKIMKRLIFEEHNKRKKARQARNNKSKLVKKEQVIVDDDPIIEVNENLLCSSKEFVACMKLNTIIDKVKKANLTLNYSKLNETLTQAAIVLNETNFDNNDVIKSRSKLVGTIKQSVKVFEDCPTKYFHFRANLIYDTYKNLK